MEELKPISKQTEETLKLLEECKEKVWKQMSEYILERMENPTNVTNEEKLDAGFMSLIAVECIIELARSGFDMLAQVNDKTGAAFTVTYF